MRFVDSFTEILQCHQSVGASTPSRDNLIRRARELVNEEDVALLTQVRAALAGRLFSEGRECLWRP